MKDFNKRKTEYLNVIKNNPELFIQMVSNTKEEARNEMMRLFLDPKNEIELDIVLGSLSFTLDLIDLAAAYSEDELEMIPFEENYGLETFSKMIKSMKENGTFNPEEFSYLRDPKTLAKAMYGLFNAMLSDKDDAEEYMANKCGLYLDNIEDRKQFDSYVEQVNKTLDDMKNQNTNVSKMSSKDGLTGNEFFNEFHRLCAEGCNRVQFIEGKDTCKRLSKLFKMLKDEE